MRSSLAVPHLCRAWMLRSCSLLQSCGFDRSLQKNSMGRPSDLWGGQIQGAWLSSQDTFKSLQTGHTYLFNVYQLHPDPFFSFSTLRIMGFFVLFFCWLVLVLVFVLFHFCFYLYSDIPKLGITCPHAGMYLLGKHCTPKTLPYPSFRCLCIF